MSRERGLEIAKGYVEFFEPDGFVEAEHGLLEEAGLGALREQNTLHYRVLPLDKLVRADQHRTDAELSFGLNIFDALRAIYKSERRFQLREELPTYLVRPQRGSGLSEAIFGVFPGEKSIAYVKKGYEDVYRPKTVAASPDVWRSVYRKGAITPLATTRYGLQERRSWNDDLVVYVFDPARPSDLIDLWNMRIESQPVLPIPIGWVQELLPDLSEILIAEHRAVQGNPFGVMHSATVEFARSVNKSEAEEIVASLASLMPARDSHAKGPGPLIVKSRRNNIWSRPVHEDYRRRPERIEVTADERRVRLKVERGRDSIAEFDSLAPDFAGRFGGRELRWVNSVQISSYGGDGYATLFPFNTFDRSWPRLAFGGEPVLVGTEGWSFGQRFSRLAQVIELQAHQEAVIDSLKLRGIQAKLSEPGYIASQILDHMKGFWALHLVADIETLQLLNTMAGGIRRRGSDADEIEEIFGRRSQPARRWEEFLSRRKNRDGYRAAQLKDFTDRNILRLGTETSCPHCKAANWHSVAEADYELRCERCLKLYPFPQADNRERNWAYRVIGPFSVPDFAKGAYGALLALRAIKSIHSTSPMTFSPALTMNFDGKEVEADYVAWVGRETILRPSRHPTLIVGEAKSLGKGDLIRPKDAAKLKLLGEKLPGATIAVSVLRDDFTKREKETLRALVRWGRRLDENGRPRNPVLLLTATELMGHHISLENVWKEKGGRYAQYAELPYSDGIYNHAEATVGIYLGMPSFEEERWNAAERRAKKRKARAAK